MSSPFKRLASLRRSDTRIQRYKEPAVEIGQSDFLYFPNSSYASSADLASGQYDPSWRRSVAQLQQSSRNSAFGSQQHQEQQQRQQQQQSTGAKIKSLFRGISIKRTRSIAKLDVRRNASREVNSSESQHGNTNNSSLASGGVGPESGSLQSGGGGSVWHDRQASGSPASRLPVDCDSASAAMKRSISMGRIGRQQPQPQPPTRQLRPASKPGGGSSGPLGLVTICVPIIDSGGGRGECFEDDDIRRRPISSRTPPDPASSGGNSLRSALSHESLLLLASSATGAPLQMNSGTEVRPVHPSLMHGLPAPSAAFAVSGGAADRGISRYFAAQSPDEAKKWQEGLKKVNRPDLESTRHKENSLKLWIFEAKRLPSKKRYFCEICLNHILYARTTSKEKTSDTDPFWGEPFEFSNLQDISLVTVKLFREANRKKKKDHSQLVGEVHLPVHEILSQTEQWYSLQPGGKSGAPGPSLRVKSRYLSVDVLPLAWYTSLRDFLMAEYCQTVRLLEPSLPVRMKEDLACGLVALAHSSGLSETLVADLLLQELEHCGSSEAAAVVAFRGNSIATKSVEYYLRLVGSDYLRSVLAEPVSILLRSDECCEVDPVRVSGAAELDSNQRSLRLFAELFWTRVYTSAERLPPEFGRLFAGIRQRSGQRLCDQLVGASIFLRFICPAILGPSLFGLCQELPGPRVARSLTLIAKTVQNLANGTSFGGKEAYMNFMNKFLEQHQANMAHFVASLQQTSLRPTDEATGAAAAAAFSSSADGVDAGFELAQLHTLLTSALDLLARQGGAGAVSGQPCLAALAGHLAAVALCLKQNAPPPASLLPPQPQPRSASLAPSNGSVADDNLATRPVREWRQLQQSPVKLSNARSTEKVTMATTSPSMSAANPRPVSALAVQEDWRRVLDEAAASAAATLATASAAVATATPALSTDSSGYQSGKLRCQPPDVSKPSNSPVQFHNPSYQKPVSALQLPSSAASQQRQQQHRPAATAFKSSSASESGSDSGSNSSELVASSSPDSSSGGTSSNASSGGDQLKQQQPPPLPPHRVRMGLKSVQHPHHQQQQQPQTDLELLELQRELSQTRRQLEAAEAQLRSNEQQKLQLLDDFRRGAEERQRREAENSRQLAEIMERLRLLETDVRAGGSRPAH